LLEDFWQSLQQNYGKAFAMSNLRRAVDGLHWEERELSEEYLLTWANLDGKSRLAQRHDTEQLLAGVPIFAECSPAELHSLAQTFSLSRYQPGQLIIRQGEVGDNFYVVKTGRVSVWQSQPGQPEQKVNSHERGGYFGEVALLKEAPRNATCKADTPVEILSLSRPDFNRLARRHFEMAERLLRRYRYLTMLQNIPLFKDTPLESLRALAGCLGCQEVAAGQTIFRQGETGECFYIIEAGQVEILLEEEAGQLRCLDQRGAGEFFGEIALLLDLPRTATVRTVTATRLLSLRRADFLNLLLNSQSLNDSLQRVASRRLLQHRSLPLA
jgi:cAMP-dependent protein kinase regulator